MPHAVDLGHAGERGVGGEPAARHLRAVRALEDHLLPRVAEHGSGSTSRWAPPWTGFLELKFQPYICIRGTLQKVCIVEL